MKSKTLSGILTIILAALVVTAFAQQPKIQNWRPYDQRGVNVFEPKKDIDTEFNGLNVRIGAAFTQQYQAVKHSNESTPVWAKLANGKDSINVNKLYPLAGGFNLATANLNIDVQLADGIRLAVENYMSARHHQEFWVKGGYIQVDKLPMFGNPDWFAKYVRVKVGHFQVNYGDQQLRRTDNGNALYNPFVGNYIMDGFATEIGGEVYLFPTSDLMVMAGATNGLIKGDVKEIDRKPSIYGKIAFDKQISDDFRFRLSASTYMNTKSGRSTLYGGDRAGSRYYFVMEPEYYVSGGVATAPTTDAQAFTGRINPGFTTNVTAFQINPFLKFKGLEVFAAYEQSTGYAGNDPKPEGSTVPNKRKVTQYSVEGIYRFLPREQAFLGARYNSVSGELSARLLDAQKNPLDLTVDRFEISAGWFATQNLLLKLEYVKQNYRDYPTNNILYNGEFNGMMIEAVVGF